MFLPNRDIQWSIGCKQLIVDPPPEHFGAGYDETSIDLHLGPISEALIWDVEALAESEKARGAAGPEVRLRSFVYGEFAKHYLRPPPAEGKTPEERGEQRVCLRGNQVIVKPGGFVLWMTKEKVGTPVENPRLIAFVNAKSTKARTGLLVHLTAPTIHAGWSGNITLEIANLGPFHLVLQEDDVIAQLTVAMITSPPDLTLKKAASQTAGQVRPTGESQPVPKKSRKGRKPR